MAVGDDVTVGDGMAVGDGVAVGDNAGLRVDMPVTAGDGSGIVGVGICVGTAVGSISGAAITKGPR